jgi:hypothetical protein
VLAPITYQIEAHKLQRHPGNVKYRVNVSSWNNRKDQMSWIVLSFWQMGWSHHEYRLLMKAGLFWEDPKYEQRLLFAIAATNPAQVYDFCHRQFLFLKNSPCKVACSRDRRDDMIRALIMSTVRDHMIMPTTPQASKLFCMLNDKKIETGLRSGSSTLVTTARVCTGRTADFARAVTGTVVNNILAWTKSFSPWWNTRIGGAP